ncbi:hypothetical protein E2L07_05890 [Halalkalibacterium halodurans]|uniref:Uncharacterized protein n=2 Tax=Halalkalibacterium halodurans TaxID=86665 RepID=A0A0M0KIS9_ALKHA|nr:hypothetical protein E2L07_05890 [Halalkalibacterium halodurans]TPE69154.1 hypothetical protein AMD02_009690 [Halalkalibacterium halodurans]
MIWMRVLLFFLVGYLSFSGIADGTSTISIEPMQSLGVISVTSGQEEYELEVRYEVKGDEVYVECMLDGFKLSQEHVGTPHHEGEGHLRVYVDGEFVGALFHKGFVVRGLNPGKHELTVEVLQNDQAPYGLEETITFTIPDDNAS